MEFLKPGLDVEKDKTISLQLHTLYIILDNMNKKTRFKT